MEGGLITVKEEFLSSVKVKAAVRIGGWEAIALWLALKGYVSAGNTGGFIPAESVPDLPGVPDNWRKAMDGLIGCGKVQADGTRGPGLVHGVAHGYVLHDYEDHGTPQEQEAARREKAREKKRKYRESISRTQNVSPACPPQCPPVCPPENDSDVPVEYEPCPPDMSDACPEDSRAQAGALPREHGRTRDPSPAQPSPKEEDPPTPFEDKPGAKRVHPDSYFSPGAASRPDVNRVHERLKVSLGLPGRKFRGEFDIDAKIIAEAIDLHGEESALLVADFAPNDDWVSGKADDKGTKHHKVSYIFGNEDTFSRIYAAATKAKKSETRTIAEKLQEMQGRSA